MIQYFKTNLDFPFDFDMEKLFDVNYSNILSEIKSDVIKTEDFYQLDVYLPGFNKENIKIKFEDSHLIISSNRIKNETANYFKSEGYFGSFEKKWKLSPKFDGDNISAEFLNGILSIKIPLIKTEKKFIKIN